jgi:chromosome segregation ATPase
MEKRVEVKIGGAVEASFKSSFSQSTDSLNLFSSEIKTLNRTVANVGSYRSLKSEVFSTATSFHEAKRGLRHLKSELEQQKSTLTGYQAKLKEQRTEVKALNAVYREKKTSIKNVENQLYKARDAFAQTHKKLEGMKRVSKAATDRYNEQKQSLGKLEEAYRKKSERVREAKFAFDEARHAAQGTNEKLKEQSVLVRRCPKITWTTHFTKNIS